MLNLFSRKGKIRESPGSAGVLVKGVVVVVVRAPVGAVIINLKTWEGQVKDLYTTIILKKIVLMLGESFTGE